MGTSKTFRMLVATAIVSALAILVTSPAQARWVNEGGAMVTPTVAAPSGAQAPRQVESPAATSDGSDGFDTRTLALVAGGAALLAGAAAFLLVARSRKVALL